MNDMGFMEELAAKVAASKASRSGNIIRPGKYLWEIQKVIAGKKHNGNMFIVEMIALESTRTEPDKDPNPVGSAASYVVNLDKDSGPGDMKSFIMAVLDLPEAQVTSKEILEVLAAEDTLAYLKVRDEAWEKPQKNNPAKMFTHHRWEHVEPSVEELTAVMKRRAEAKVAKPA